MPKLAYTSTHLIFYKIHSVVVSRVVDAKLRRKYPYFNKYFIYTLLRVKLYRLDKYLYTYVCTCVANRKIASSHRATTTTPPQTQTFFVRFKSRTHDLFAIENSLNFSRPLPISR